MENEIKYIYLFVSYVSKYIMSVSVISVCNIKSRLAIGFEE